MCPLWWVAAVEGALMQQLRYDDQLKYGDIVIVNDCPVPVRITKEVVYEFEYIGTPPLDCTRTGTLKFFSGTKVLRDCPHGGQIAGKFCQECGERV